jgi:hypothetical protein
MGRGQQIEKRLDWESATAWGEKPWGIKKRSQKFNKDLQHRRERRRAKQDPECPPEYRKYDGYDW